jgi:RNA polymerase sigma-70 factor (ECF subfamily)
MQFSKVRKGYMSDRKKEQAVERALTEGYEKYYRLAYSYVHNEADALDIVQEAAYKAILKSDSLKEPQYVETWVYRIVINEACSFLRSRKESVDVEEIQAASEDIYENIDPKDRAIVVLRFFEDRQLEEIAKILDENLSTVKSRLYRVMKKLRLNLEGSMG